MKKRPQNRCHRPHFVALLLLGAVACARTEPNPGQPPTGPRLVDLPPGIFDLFMEPADAPNESLRNAAQAVVRLERPTGTLGTAFFLGKESLLVTNAHVLGPKECMLTGCTVRIHDHQHRVDPEKASSTWRTLKPFAFSAELDVAIFEVFEDAATTKRFISPHVIAWDPNITPSPEDALDQTGSLLGHPLGLLLKRTEGSIVDLNGPFLTTELLSLPGTSGGPLLDGKGRLLGVHHHGTQDLQYLRNASYFGVSLSTATRELAKLLEEPQRSASLSPFKKTSDWDPGDPSMRDYWEAISASPLADSPYKAAEEMADWLWALCTSPESDAPGAACELALLRLSCSDSARPSIETGGPESSCPKNERAAAWLKRFEARSLLFPSSTRNFLWSVVAPSRIVGGENFSARSAVWSKTILDQASQKGLDLEMVVVGLDATQSKSFDDPGIRSWFTNPKSIKQYHFLYSQLLQGAFVLTRDGILNREAGERLLRDVKGDELATLSDLLLADSLLWKLERQSGGPTPSLSFSLF